jgi:hypothetical protein
VGVARSRTLLALCLALLRHPSGLSDATRGARGSAPAASPQMAVTGFLSSRNQEAAGQSTNFGQMALARLSDKASWLMPPDTAETRVSASPRLSLATLPNYALVESRRLRCAPPQPGAAPRHTPAPVPATPSPRSTASPAPTSTGPTPGASTNGSAQPLSCPRNGANSRTASARSGHRG